MSYVAGKNFDADVSMFLNPTAYQMGNGGGSSYLAEAYVAGGLAGAVIVSAALRALVHGMNVYARNPFGLFLIAMILPALRLTRRGGLMDWISASRRVGISVILLAPEWYFSQAIARIASLLWARAIRQAP